MTLAVEDSKRVGSSLGGLIGWRGVFWLMVPLTLASFAWQWVSLPALPPQAPNPVCKLFRLLQRPNVAFTYFRPFLGQPHRRTRPATLTPAARPRHGRLRGHRKCEQIRRPRRCPAIKTLLQP
jgi:hypothetical protein